VQIEIILKFVLNYTFKMGFFNILNVKQKIIIMLIIIFKNYFQYIKTFSCLHVILF